MLRLLTFFFLFISLHTFAEGGFSNTYKTMHLLDAVPIVGNVKPETNTPVSLGIFRNNQVSFQHSPNKKNFQDDGTVSHFGLNFRAGAGKLKYTIENKEKYKFDNTIIKGVGLSYEIPLTSISDRFSLYNELSFSQFKSVLSQTITDTAHDPMLYYTIEKITFAPNHIELGNYVKYSFTPGPFRYYLGIGIYNRFTISCTNHIDRTVYINGVPTSSTGEAVPQRAKHGLMLMLSTGFTYNGVGLEFRFDPGHNYTNKIDHALYMSSFSCVLHVRMAQKQK